ncbi:MAG: hypothetical protein R3297_06220, partial [Desulfobulbales bacterium]|nr:hypothetical protein [Desulfobulbales bacterium]
LHEKADYSQFQQGKKVLEQYINEHPDTSDNFKGLKFLVDRIEEEIITKWSAWKSLREERNELKTEVGTLQKQIAADKLFIGELQEQIEQLKNIENIIESRETEQK